MMIFFVVIKATLILNYILDYIKIKVNISGYEIQSEKMLQREN